jgi:hypothetical protein
MSALDKLKEPVNTQWRLQLFISTCGMCAKPVRRQWQYTVAADADGWGGVTRGVVCVCAGRLVPPGQGFHQLSTSGVSPQVELRHSAQLADQFERPATSLAGAWRRGGGTASQCRWRSLVCR